MSGKSEIIGTVKITDGWRICLLSDARAEMVADLDVGDDVVFKRVGDRIVVEPA